MPLRIDAVQMSGKNRQFLCSLGCAKIFNSKQMLMAHCYDEHTHIELHKWGINKELLAKEVQPNL